MANDDADCREQQMQELEALESMYASELAILCRDYPNICVRVEVRPESAEFEKAFGRELAPLLVTLPAQYPNSGPDIDLTPLTTAAENEEEDSDGENGGGQQAISNNKSPNNPADRAQLIEQIRAELDTAIEESLGMPMLFTLINAYQEALVKVCTEHSDAAAELARLKAEKAEREEQARFEGTRVTVESFNKWNKAFLEEMRLKKAKEEGKDPSTTSSASANRLTGKQLFLADRSLNISDLQFLNLEEDKEEELAAAAGKGGKAKRGEGENVQIDETLFQEELGDLEDLDDLDTDDEDGDDEEDEDYEPNTTGDS